MISTRHLKAWQRFNDDLRAFALETEGSEDAEVTLYEDAYTTRNVRGFGMSADGLLVWWERDSWKDEAYREAERMLNEDDAREWLSFWRANLRRARRYWAMDADRLDAIQEGTIEDEEENN